MAQSGSGKGGKVKAALPADLPNLDIGPNVVRREYVVGVPGFARKLLLSIMTNPDDLPLVYLMVNLACSILPSAALMYYLPKDGENAWMKPAWGLVHLFMVFVMFIGRFILALHFSAHRKVFNGPGQFGASLLNNANEMLFSPFFGIPSGMYTLHHVIMHHIENNVCPRDMSSTMPFQRDSWLHFFMYWARFTLAQWAELPFYALRRGRYRLAVGSASCIIGYIISVYYLLQYDFVATLMVFVIPWAVTSLALMFGNWSQHIFVDPADPYSNYKLTYNVINTPDNQFTFNDGYHINHHINSRLHWTKLPHYFMDHMDEFAREDAFIFTGLGFFEVGWLVMTGQLRKLAKHYVPYGQKARTEDEIVAEFKRRLVPIAAADNDTK